MDEKEAEARPVMGTIFLVLAIIIIIFAYNWASGASPTPGCSIEIRVIFICCRYVVCLSYVKLTA